ncbi:serine/threonine/tyrosine-interacting-like protein 1 isoform X2 [Sinocyclocheilus rhinocerous]|uniref:serine/threonine/tyrosine-interacting-like protein 1 isoform X2 n=1 Tax=Sinocyclocheilus rhinocerous TaxID=307959 RepID=UPI0007BAC3D6|nr:PREDICTED: serine/threonine/tyrosine-interacting-like protein 1 isoform X2 [Sinocyclocheilus rhinocerous]
MAGKVLCEATKLYNILNQYTFLPRLAESNYLCLIDARAAESYNFSHIITARNAKWDSDGKFIMPLDVEVESMRYIIVYDSSTHSLSDSGPAIDCADSIEKSSQFPVQILSGGYEKFSALYPFLRTPKILYNIRELESLNPYPVEILPGKLYMGDYRQATNLQILKDLKLNALVNVSDECSLVFQKANCTVLHIRMADSAEADLITSFERMCVFIVSRCCAVTMAYLMYHLKYTLKEAWNHIQQCKANMKPNRGFVQQLSDWELQTLGKMVTDISEPNY